MTKDTDKTKEQLLFELSELRKKSKEQKNKLMAANQQLDASNQQLISSEKSLQESVEKFSKAFNLHPSSMAIIDIDTLERIAVNDYFVELVGYSREKLMANPLGALGELDPDKIQVAVKAVKKGISLRDVDVMLTDSEGSKRVMSYAVEGIKIGERNCMIVSGSDITKRKRAEEEIKAANQQLNAQNQQLRATEQQLRAGNQQLIASEAKFKSYMQNAPDEIFSNTFEGLTHANHATNQNWETYPHIGLTYYCNINSSNVNDFFFTYDGDYQTYLASGVQTGQGDTTKSAGNTFTPNISGFNIFNNTSHGVGYYYNSNIPIEQPLVYSGNGIVTTHGQNLAASCSGGISPKELTVQEKSAIETDYLAYESSYESIKSLYESLEDGGNTDELQTEVISSWPSEMWELRAELLGLSPYLSTDVLKTAADKTEVLPESVLFEILSANPEELKKEELLSYLENKEEPLPDYMIDILRQLASGHSAKTILQNQLAQYNRAKSRSAMEMLACLPYDEVFDYSNYRLWLNRLGGINNDRRIVASFIEEENYTDALSLANMLPELYELEEQALIEHEFYIDLIEFNINLKQTNRSPLEITEEEFVLIEYIAQNSTSAPGVNAKAILEHFYDQHFCNCVNTSVDVNKSANASIDPNQFAEAMGLFITADPNPATTWVSFNYQLPIGKEKAVLTITNTEAKQIAQFIFTSEVGQKVWDTRSINAGTYIYEYICDDLKQSGKIVIIK